MENLAIFNTYAHTLNDEDLNQAWRILYDEHQRREKDRQEQNRYTLKVGDTVEWFSGHSRSPKTGEVVKVKRKKAIVVEHISGKLSPGNSRWDIPMGMLKKI